MQMDSGSSFARQPVEFAGFRLDIQRRQLTARDGAPIALNSRAFDTLLALVARRGETLSKQQLLEAVWPNAVVEENNLNQAISSLRKALGDSRDDAKGRLILTIPGRGYCFVGDVKTVEDVPVAPAFAVAAPEAVASAAVLPPLQTRSLTPSFVGFGAALVVAVAAAAFIALKPAAPELAAASAVATTPANAAVMADPARILPHSVAVLPFTTRSFDPGKEYFTRGLHDELLRQLGSVRDLNVIQRASVQRYRDSSLPPAEIAQQLAVQSLLGGRLRFSDRRITLDLQLSDPYTGLNLWSASYDTGLDDMSGIAAMQADIATHVASALDAVLLPQEIERLSRVPTTSPEAYKSYLKGVAAQVQGDYASASFQLQQALALDAGFHNALVRLSMINNLLATSPILDSKVEHFAEAGAAARQAIALNNDSADAHYALATSLHNAGDWKGAAAEYRLARRLGSPVDASSSYAMFELSLGDFGGARSTLKRQLHTDPVNLTGRGFLMLAEELMGNRDQSVQEYEKGEKQGDTEWWGDNTGLWLALGRNDREFLEKSAREFNRYVLPEMLEKYADAEQALQQLNVIHHDMAAWDSGQLINAAMFAAWFGETDMAMDMLRAGLQDNWINTYVVWLPIFDDVRRSEGFRQFVQEVGFVDYWRQEGWPQVCKPVGTDINCDWQALPHAQ